MRRSASQALLVVASLVLAVLLAPASAQAEVDEIEPVSSAGYRHYLVTTPSGETVLAWEEAVEDPTTPFGERYDLYVAVKPPDGPVGEPQLIAEGIANCTVLLDVDEDGNVALGWSDEDGDHTMVRAPGGEFGSLQTLPDFQNNGGYIGFKMDIADGNVGIAKAYYMGGGYEYWVSRSRAGAPYTRPVTLGIENYGEVYGYDVDLAPDGTQTAVWVISNDGETHYWVRSRTLSALGDRGELQTLASSPEKQHCPELQGDAAGNLVVVWKEMSRDYQCYEYAVNVAVRAGTALFSEPQRFVIDGGATHPAVGVGNDGTIAIAYSEWGGPPQSTLITGRFGLPLQKLTLPGLRVAGLGLTSLTSAVVAFNDNNSLRVGEVGLDGLTGATPKLPYYYDHANIKPVGGDRFVTSHYDYDTRKLLLVSGDFDADPADPEIEPPSLPPVHPPPVPPLVLDDDGRPSAPLGRFVARGVTCNMACRATGTGRILVPGGKRDLSFKLGGDRVNSGPKGETLRLRLSPRARRVASRRLRQGKEVLAGIEMKASAAGQRASLSATVQLMANPRR